MAHRRSAGLAALALTGLVLAACSSPGGSPAGGSTSGAGIPARTLTIGSSAAPPSLDPTSSPAAATEEVLDYNVYQHLVQLAPNGLIVPVLANGYSWSADRKTITFTIRQGVRFSNGDPLTAQDVIYSINRVVAKGSTYPHAPLMGMLTSVTATSPATVSVRLAHPDQKWLYQLAAYSNGVILDPRAAGQIATAPVGTGPFEFKRQVTGSSVTLAANPGYWGYRPGFGTVVFRYFSDASAEDSALSSGQIQVIDHVPDPAGAAQFKDNPSVTLVRGPASRDAITVVKTGIKGLPTPGQPGSFNLAYVTTGTVPSLATAQGFSS